MNEFATRWAIEDLQLRKLRSLRQAVVPANPFYSHKLAAVPKDPWAGIEDYRRSVPFTTRHELVRDRLSHPPYGSNLTFPLREYVRCHQTSGTTTVPIRWLDTQQSWDAVVDN